MDGLVQLDDRAPEAHPPARDGHAAHAARESLTPSPPHPVTPSPASTPSHASRLTSSSPLIAVLPCALDHAETLDRLSRLGARWPGGGDAPPRFALIAERDWRAAVHDAIAQGAACVLVIGARAVARPIVASLTSLTENAGVGTLALVHGPGGAMPCAPSQHVVEIDDAAGPGATAGALFALARLHHALHTSASELRIEAQVRSIASKQLDEQDMEQNLAAMVQREFFPKQMPTPPGVRAAVLFRPKSMLSGDFYDVARLDEHHTAFFLADACGHGVPAALLMMLMSKLLPMKEISGQSYRLLEPREALTRLNAAFAERKGEAHALVSACYGVINGQTGTVRMASAGHPPAVLLSAAGASAPEAAGPLLGTLDDFEYEQVEAHMDSGDLLVLHSDGLPPALGLTETDVLGDAPLLRALHGSACAADLTQAVLDLGVALDARSGSLHQHDDLTVLLIQRAMSDGAKVK